MGKSTISMAIFNSYVSLPEGSTVETFRHAVLRLDDLDETGGAFFAPPIRHTLGEHLRDAGSKARRNPRGPAAGHRGPGAEITGQFVEVHHGAPVQPKSLDAGSGC
jgi:hypothetical protein